MNTERCAGLFAPCDNEPDSAYDVEDPDGKLPTVKLCAVCGEASKKFFDKIFADPEKTQRFSDAVEAYSLVNTQGRGSS